MKYFTIIALSLVTVLLLSCEDESKTRTNSNDLDINSFNKINSDDNKNIDNSNSKKSYCDLSSSELFEYLLANTFTLKGNGRISFNKTFDYSKDRWVEGKVRISGGRATLSGDYSIISGDRIYIDNLSANSGTFDVSRNNG